MIEIKEDLVSTEVYEALIILGFNESDYLPTQSLAQKFLMTKGFLVTAKHFTQNWYEWLIQPFSVDDMGNRIWEKELSSETNEGSIEEAMHKGLETACLLIK